MNRHTSPMRILKISWLNKFGGDFGGDVGDKGFFFIVSRRSQDFLVIKLRRAANEQDKMVQTERHPMFSIILRLTTCTLRHDGELGFSSGNAPTLSPL